MDYLLRDSLHAGVAYGRFDHFRLIDTLRFLPTPGPTDGSGSKELQLGVTEGGLHAAEALLLARHFMFAQVYLHPVRRIYDLHLGEFLKAWLAPSGRFPTDVDEYLALTDAEVTTALRHAAIDAERLGHDPAQRIVNRQHFKRIWTHNRRDIETNANAGEVIYLAASAEFDASRVRHDRYIAKGVGIDFPVELSDRQVVSAQAHSSVIEKLPPIPIDTVFIHPDLKVKAQTWLNDHLVQILHDGPSEDKE